MAKSVKGQKIKYFIARVALAAACKFIRRKCISRSLRKLTAGDFGNPAPLNLARDSYPSRGRLQA